jgi:hypothetical protein
VIGTEVAVPPAGVTFTVIVYEPIVVPGFPVAPVPLLFPLHPVTAAIATKTTAAKVIAPRRSHDTRARRNMQARAAPISERSSQFGP